MKCEFCGKSKKLKIRAENRIICQRCWEKRKTRCLGAVEAHSKIKGNKSRCKNSTIDPSGLCHWHQDRQPENWYSCVHCQFQMLIGVKCWRCEEYGIPRRSKFK